MKEKNKQPQVIGGIGEKKSNGGTQWFFQDRVYEGDNAVTVTSEFNPYYVTGARVVGNMRGGKWEHTYESARRVYDANYVAPTICVHGGGNQEEKIMDDLRIRKLTPRECFRLMGVKDEDYDKLEGISDSVKYHLAGDSIVVDVLMAIFKELL